MAAEASTIMLGRMNHSRRAKCFFGDYSGIAAYGGRVYGIWTEKPAPPPEAKDKTEAGKDPRRRKPQPRGTIVKIGTADFSKPDSK